MSDISRRHRLIVIAAALCLLYVFNLWLTNVLRELAGVVTIWTANAFVIAAMLLLPSRWSGTSRSRIRRRTGSRCHPG